MSLSLPNLPTFSDVMPSTKKTFKYRPFTVGEQKILLTAKESKNVKDMVAAVKDVLRRCTFDAVDMESRPIFDLEYMLLKVRSKSVSEISNFEVKCPHCEQYTPVTVNIDEVKIHDNPNYKGPDISLDTQYIKGLSVKMRFPTYDEMEGKTINDFIKGDPDELITLIARLIEVIYEGEKTYTTKDVTIQDVKDWIEALVQVQLGKMIEFLFQMPSLYHLQNYKCTNPECGKEGKFIVTSFEDFF